MLDWLPAFALYAEIHYRFRGFPFSRYYVRQPEIIFDAPHRIEPASPLPIFLIVKDAEHYPVFLREARLQVSDPSHNRSYKFPLNWNPGKGIAFQTFALDVSEFSTGPLLIDALALVENKSKQFIVRNDNYRGLSHSPLTVYKAEHPRPRLPGWFAGDIHCHSEFGGDQVEFGAPLQVYKQAAQAMGLDWVGLTDHSYNLDDELDNYLIDDPFLKKWTLFGEAIDKLNQESQDVLLIPGEELTCRSSTGRNEHLLLLGNSHFLKGSGDGAQKWFHTHSEYSIDQALKLIDQDAFAAAAHPLQPTPVLEGLLLKRGKWTPRDLSHLRLDGWQIVNGSFDKSFQKAKELWIRELAAGRRLSIQAGSDAHGNLNRFRQVKIPMLRLVENQSHRFGQVITYVKLDARPSVSGIIKALRLGKSMVSDGPALDLAILKNGRYYRPGDIVNNVANCKIEISAYSSPEFGKLKCLKVFTCVAQKEVLIFKKDLIPHSKSDPFKVTFDLSLNSSGYLRAELNTIGKTNKIYHCLTNPIWITA